MNPVVTAVVGLVLLANANALPIGNGINGISLAPISLNSFYNQEVVIGRLPLRYGFGWDKDGTLTAGLRVESQFNGKSLPLSAAVSGNLKDLKKTFSFEVGARVLDSLAGVVYGDKNGLKWLSSLWVPVGDQRGTVNAVGVSMEGDSLKPVAVAGGIGVKDQVYQGRVTLDKNMKPSGTNFIVGFSPYSSHRKY